MTGAVRGQNNAAEAMYTSYLDSHFQTLLRIRKPAAYLSAPLAGPPVPPEHRQPRRDGMSIDFGYVDPDALDYLIDSGRVIDARSTEREMIAERLRDAKQWVVLSRDQADLRRDEFISGKAGCPCAVILRPMARLDAVVDVKDHVTFKLAEARKAAVDQYVLNARDGFLVLGGSSADVPPTVGDLVRRWDDRNVRLYRLRGAYHPAHGHREG